MNQQSTDRCGVARPSEGVRVLATLSFALVMIAGVLLADRAPAQTLQERASTTQSKISAARDQEGVLTTQISHFSGQISGLNSQIAGLRSREATLGRELAGVQRKLTRAIDELVVLRSHLKRAMADLKTRLVEIYKSGEPDMITVLLNANGYDDLLERSGYLDAIQNHDSTVVGRVRDLRNQMRATVTQVRESRDKIASQKQEIQSVRSGLESREAQLASARSGRKSLLGRISSHRKDLEGDLSAISDKIAEQLGAGSPVGPVRPARGGFIWPVNGPITSGFGMRWGSMHEGLDIAAPSGTPIRAAKAGTIVLAAYTGGYGNYTCIDHGGGVSTCYGHQTGFALTSGTVSQGTVIGYVGSTGHSTGPHLHFEVRINGTPVDPLGYL